MIAGRIGGVNFILRRVEKNIKNILTDYRGRDIIIKRSDERADTEKGERIL